MLDNHNNLNRSLLQTFKTPTQTHTLAESNDFFCGWSLVSELQHNLQYVLGIGIFVDQRKKFSN